jgi:predicted XRE-type DNA-binding protein
MMEVTEHNITDWNLNQSEIKELIRITKNELKNNSDDKTKELFYGMILRKLIIMKNDQNL